MRCAVRRGDVRDVADHVDARQRPSTVRSACTSIRPPRPCGSPASGRERRRHDPPPHTTQRVRIVGRRRPSVTCPGADLGDRDAEMQPHALAAEHLGGVVVGLVGERPEQRVAEVDDVDLRRRDRDVRRTPTLIVSWIRSASAPASSTPVGPPPTTTKFSAPCVDQRRVAVGLLEDLDDARAQPLGVVEAVQRERVLLGARRCGRSSAASRRPGRCASPAMRSPPAVVTACAAGSSDVTSRELDAHVGRRRGTACAASRRCRSEASCEVATW